MPTKQRQAEWVALSGEYVDAGWQCVLARHEAQKFPVTADVIAAYVKASERWVDLVLKTSDFVRDCRV